MVIQAPTTPAGWLFTGLALLDIPIQACQIINPEGNMQNFEVSAILGKALGTSISSLTRPGQGRRPETDR
jgi:hypothetical protein